MKLLFIILFSFSSLNALAWQKNLENEIKKIDQNFPGQIGLVVKNLKDGTQLEYNAQKSWYLSSTMKVIVAVSLMEEVEAGRISLDQKLTLKTKDYVDGAGKLLWTNPGAQFSVNKLLKSMLRESDNTAADLLIGLIGAEKLNQDFKKWIQGAGEATSLLEVRYLVYKELHPRARSLTNMDFIHFKNKPIKDRHKAFAKKLKVPLSELNSPDLESAQEKFYSHGYNSGNLKGYVDFLIKLEAGKLLNPENTALILTHMEHMETGDHRIKAGLGKDYIFMQKTGTQLHRACNMGLIKRPGAKQSGLALAVCLKKPSDDLNSDVVFQKIGKKIRESALPL